MVGNSFWKHKDSATLDRIWKLFCHHRIFFLPLLAQFLIVSHDIWCVRKRLYTCSFRRLNSSHSFRKHKNSAAESFRSEKPRRFAAPTSYKNRPVIHSLTHQILALLFLSLQSSSPGSAFAFSP